MPVDPSHKAPDVADQPSPPQSDQQAPDAKPVQKHPDAAPQAAAPQIVPPNQTPPAAGAATGADQFGPAAKPAEAAPDGAGPDAGDCGAANADAAVQDAVTAAVAAAAADTSASANNAAATGLPKGPPMTQGEKDAFRAAVSKCWNLGTLSTGAMQTTVTISVTMAENGTPDFSSIHMTSFKDGTQADANLMFEAAKSAIYRCGRDGFPLPPDKYAQWKDLELVFDPSGMRQR